MRCKLVIKTDSLKRYPGGITLFEDMWSRPNGTSCRSFLDKLDLYLNENSSSTRDNVYWLWSTDLQNTCREILLYLDTNKTGATIDQLKEILINMKYNAIIESSSKSGYKYYKDMDSNEIIIKL